MSRAVRVIDTEVSKQMQKNQFRGLLLLEGVFGVLLLLSLFFVVRGQVPNMPPVFLYFESEDAFRFSRQIVEDAKETFEKMGKGSVPQSDQAAIASRQGVGADSKPIQGMKIQLEASETSYWQSLNADPSAIGVKLGLIKPSKSQVSQIHLTFSATGELSEGMVDLLRLVIQGAYLSIVDNPNASVIDVVSREDKTAYVQLNQKQLILPVYLTLNIIFAAMWLGFSLKLNRPFSLQTNSTLQSGPVKGLNSQNKLVKVLITHMLPIISMTLSFAMVAIAVTIGLIGVRSYSLLLILFVACSSFFAFIAGMFIRATSKHRVASNVVMIVVQIVQIIPLISYFLPSFNAWWLKIIPSYSLMFLFKEIVRGERVWDTVQSGALNDFGLSVLLFSGILILSSLLWRNLLGWQSKYKMTICIIAVAIFAAAIFYSPNSRLSFINMAVIEGAQDSLVAELKTLGSVTVVEDRDDLERMIDGRDDIVGIDTTQITPQIILEGDEVLMPQLIIRGILDRHLSHGKPQLLVIDHEVRPKMPVKIKTEAAGIFGVPLVMGTLISVLILVFRCVIYVGLTGKFTLSISTK